MIRRYAVLIEADPDAPPPEPVVEGSCPTCGQWHDNYPPLSPTRAVLVRRDEPEPDDQDHSVFSARTLRRSIESFGPVQTAVGAWNRVAVLDPAEAHAVEAMADELIDTKVKLAAAEARIERAGRFLRDRVIGRFTHVGFVHDTSRKSLKFSPLPATPPEFSSSGYVSARDVGLDEDWRPVFELSDITIGLPE